MQLERAFADMEDAPVMMAEPPAMSSTAISVIRYRFSSGLILASDLASSWARSSGERSIRSADPPLYTNWASGAESWRDRWVNRRRATHACSLKFSRAAMSASSKLGTTTISYTNGSSGRRHRRSSSRSERSCSSVMSSTTRTSKYGRSVRACAAGRTS